MKPTLYTSLITLTADSATLIAQPSYAGNGCEVKSEIASLALVELYTSKVASFQQRERDAVR